MSDLNRRQFLGAAIGAAALAPRSWAAAAEAEPAPAEGLSVPPLETIALGRLAFGVSAADLAALRALGPTPSRRLASWLELQLDPDSIDDAGLERRLSAARLTTLAKSVRELWADHVVPYQTARGMAPGQQAVGKRQAGDAAPPMMKDETAVQELALKPVEELETASWLRAVHSRRQLREVLVDFWHDHFNVYGWESLSSPLFVAFDRDVIRRHALGNFREMLEAVAKSPSMLIYLDNTLSASANPNENYARELMELHTLGAENYLGTRDRSSVPRDADGLPVGYVDGDVYESARAFTGWRVGNGQGIENTGEFTYYRDWHDRFQKIVLGRSIPELQAPLKDGLAVLDVLADHPGTARHVCLRLCRRLVADQPPPELVAAAAKVFHDERRSPDQLKRVVRTIALSPEFSAAWGLKLRRPFELAVAMMRATGAEFSPRADFFSAQARTGQRLFQCGTPDGYPDAHSRWGSTTSMLDRWRWANTLTGDGWKGVRADAAAQTPAGLTTPRELAGYWTERALGWPGSAAHREIVAQYLARGGNLDAPLSDSARRERLSPAVALTLMSPDFQLR